jgi:hypothetical protein
MRTALALLAAPALLVSGEACAQMVPGFAPPKDVADAVGDSLFGCNLAAYGRPMAGLNSDFSLAGEGLHPAGEVPAALKPLVNATTRTAVLDAPGGAVWIFFDTARRRCSVVPDPAETAAIDAVAARHFAPGPGSEWKPLKDKPGVYEQKLRGEPVMRAWYQAADGTLPQMIIMEPKQ